MSQIQDFVKNGGSLSEPELVEMLRAEILAMPVAERRSWVQQSLLSLDGYGGEHNIKTANRVKSALSKLESEIAGS